MHTLPPIAISLGDPTGIGPEVTLKALAARPHVRACIYGDAKTLAETAARLGLPMPASVEAVGPAGPFPPGTPSAASGQAQIAALEAAVDAVLSHKASALVTAPIHKASAHAAGFAFPGHTEYLATRAGARRWAMMFATPASDSLRVVLTTIHVPLAEVPRLLTSELVADAIVLCVTALVRDFGVTTPRIAVCGLNPHASEQGAFGHEEQTAIQPGMEGALEELRSLGHRATLFGPEVPDAVFRLAVQGAYDAVVAQYHDQGLIPFKLRHFHDGVNITLGLPFVRTSPDHGTAHDIAGSGRADARSMVAALDLAVSMSRRRREISGAMSGESV